MVLFFHAISQRDVAAERGVHLSLLLSRHGGGDDLPIQADLGVNL